MKSSIKLILLVVALAGGEPSRAADSGSQDRAGGDEGRQAAPARVSIIDALEAQAAEFGKEITNRAIRADQQMQAADSSAGRSGTVWMLLAFTLGGILAVQKFAPAFGQLFSRSCVSEPATPVARADTSADDEAYSRFATDFFVRRQRPDFAPSDGVEDSDSVRRPYTPKEDSKPGLPPHGAALLDACLAGASRDLAAMRLSFSELGRAPDDTPRQTALGQLLCHVRSLKARSEVPEMRPVWQIAGALEGLLDQIATDPAKATPSALRTAAGGVDLLHALCVRGLEPDLLSDPPVRLLAVDDDPVCRHVVSFALNKVLGEPDLATDGAAALVLAQKEFYDVIFLDVEMPGMDGYELCFSIHATALNQNTPVVFVTSHNDFDSRAKSLLTGGQDLLGKPFLTWELALKALTMIIRRRLQASLGGTEFVPRDSAVSCRATPGHSAVSFRPIPVTERLQPDSLLPGPA